VNLYNVQPVIGLPCHVSVLSLQQDQDSHLMNTTKNQLADVDEKRSGIILKRSRLVGARSRSEPISRLGANQDDQQQPWPAEQAEQNRIDPKLLRCVAEMSGI
jgi:hypothetical protein